MEYKIYDGGRDYRYTSIVDARKKAVDIVRNHVLKHHIKVHIWAGSNVYGWVEFTPVGACRYLWVQNKVPWGITQQGVKIDGTLW